MPSSDTELCNLALSHLGEAPIVSLNDDSKAARACALEYQPTLDALLREHRWNFAKDRATLSQLSAVPAFGWDHAYQLPSNFLRVLEFNDTEIGDVISEEFDIEGQAILTDSDAVNLVFIKRITDTTLFDALFVRAFSLQLAINISAPILGTTNKTAELQSLYDARIGPKARRIDANESRRRKRTNQIALNSPAIRARGCGI